MVPYWGFLLSRSSHRSGKGECLKGVYSAAYVGDYEMGLSRAILKEVLGFGIWDLGLRI